MYTVLLIIHILVSIGLITTVLLQSGRSAGLSGAIAGAGQQLFGKKRGIDELLSRVTTGLAVGFMVTSLALTLLHG